MTEQERLRTEAEPVARLRRMLERMSGSDRWDPYIDAAVEAARIEGVREIRPAITDVRLAAEANGHGWIVTTDAWARLVLAAGPNASESGQPPEAERMQTWPCAECGEPVHLRHLNSPPMGVIIEHFARVAGRAVQDDGLDVERLAVAIKEWGQHAGVGYGALPTYWTNAAHMVARSYLRAAPPLHDPTGDDEVFDSETFMAGARASRNNRAEIERGDANNG